MVIFGTDLTVSKVVQESIGDVSHWLPDAAGVVLRGHIMRGPGEREPHFLVDRDGETWSLDLDIDRLIDVLDP